MFDLRKLLARPSSRGALAGSNGHADNSHSPDPAEGLEVEYQELISSQLRRSGIADTCASLEVRRFGRAPDGFDVFVGMVRLHHWERRSGLRLLLGLPMMEKRVRRVVHSTWLADYSHFGGLWLHASEKLQAGPAPHELRQLLMSLSVPATDLADDSLPPGSSVSTGLGGDDRHVAG